MPGGYALQIRIIDSTSPDKTLLPFDLTASFGWLVARKFSVRRRCESLGRWRVESGHFWVVAERGSVDEGVVLAARTIGALCMRAESSMHFLSSACSKDSPTSLPRHLMSSLSRCANLGPASTPLRQGRFATPLEIASQATVVCPMVYRVWRRGGQEEI